MQKKRSLKCSGNQTEYYPTEKDYLTGIDLCIAPNTEPLASGLIE